MVRTAVRAAGAMRALAPCVAVLLAACAQHAAVPRDVVYLPTPPVVIDAMLDLAAVTGDDVLIDLGSGDGRIPIAAARRAGTRGLGVEIDPDLVALSRAGAEQAGVADKVMFSQGDLFRTDLRPASIVTMYLLPSINRLLRPRLLAELKPGTRIVSHDFDMGEWPSDKDVMLPRAKTFGEDSRVYLWIVPARVEGQWELVRDGPGRGARFRIDLRQRFQELGGTATLDGRAMRLEGRLAGNRITFTLGGDGGAKAIAAFTGRVLDGEGGTGERMEGTGDWHAVRIHS